MTRDDWTRVEPVATQALAMSPEEQRALIESAGLSEPIRFELLAALQRLRQSSSVAVAATPTPTATPTPLAGAGRHGAPPRLPLPALAPGMPLDEGRYIVVRQIGRGGMGTVFLANDTKLGMLVALKVTPHDARVLDEARRAAACSGHPHVATIHNVFDQDIAGRKVGVLVMEYVAGTPASRILDDGPVPVPRALRWARQVADAVAHAHDHQVLHCDLKPANIIITPEGNAKVLDFGIARATFDPSDPGEPLRGTIPYMAPEQLLAKEFTAAGDIYSLGVTLFELITGRLPFEGDDAALRLRIVVAPPPNVMDLVPGVPPQLHGVIDRALAKEPQRRYRSARSFERALDSVETGAHHTTATVPVPTPTPAPISVWSKVGVATVAITFVLAGLIGLGAYTSATYNLTLERAGFASETIFDWLNWGFRASTGPFAVLIMATLAWGAVLFIGRVALRTFDANGRLQARAGKSLGRVRVSFGIDATAAKAVSAMICSIAALALAIFLHRELFPAFISLTRTSPVEQLALLSPDYIGEHNAYRRSFSLVVILSLAMWWAVLKTADSRHATPRGLLVGGAATLLAALVLLHHPHRMMFSETAGYGAEVVRWNEHDCYVLGQRGSDTLLVCPALAPPRHRIVRTGDPGVVPTGVRESVFRGFYRQAGLNRSKKGVS